MTQESVMWRWSMLWLLLVSGCVRGASPTELADAKAMVARGALLLDVRTREEFAEGHLDGAVNVPVQELAAFEVPVDREVVVYCRSGRRSASAKTQLEGRGVKRVVDVGGMSNWK
ncbi:MAG: rhodanese-like domain-containing protein [Archangium sp.]